MPGEVIPPADTPSSLSGAWRYTQPLSAWFSIPGGGGCSCNTRGLRRYCGERGRTTGWLASWMVRRLVGWLVGKGWLVASWRRRCRSYVNSLLVREPSVDARLLRKKRIRAPRHSVRNTPVVKCSDRLFVGGCTQQCVSNGWIRPKR